MSTRYHQNGRAAYECAGSRADQQATPGCRSVAAATLDEAVAERLLAAVCPEEVALALAAATEVADRHARTTRAAELAVERVRYQADRAERAFHACEPENRLVARSLEARWEAKLAALAEAEQAPQVTQAKLTPLPQPTELQALTSDLPRLWHAPTTSAKDRKRMLRTLIADVAVLPEPDRGKLPPRHPLALGHHRRAAHQPPPVRDHAATHPARCRRAAPAPGTRPRRRRTGRRAQRRRLPHRRRASLRSQGRALAPPRPPRRPAGRRLVSRKLSCANTPARGILQPPCLRLACMAWLGLPPPGATILTVDHPRQAPTREVAPMVRAMPPPPLDITAVFPELGLLGRRRW
jgi:hypothetical protein